MRTLSDKVIRLNRVDSMKAAVARLKKEFDEYAEAWPGEDMQIHFGGAIEVLQEVLGREAEMVRGLKA